MGDLNASERHVINRFNTSCSFERENESRARLFERRHELSEKGSRRGGALIRFLRTAKGEIASVSSKINVYNDGERTGYIDSDSNGVAKQFVCDHRRDTGSGVGGN